MTSDKRLDIGALSASRNVLTTFLPLRDRNNENFAFNSINNDCNA